jgi:hypothetical protein
MVSADKVNVSLYCLHSVIVHARMMAYKNEPAAEISTLLDYAEMLPRLLASAQDATTEFQDYLVAISKRFPRCSYLVDTFANGTPPRWM